MKPPTCAMLYLNMFSRDLQQIGFRMRSANSSQSEQLHWGLHLVFESPLSVNKTKQKSPMRHRRKKTTCSWPTNFYEKSHKIQVSAILIKFKWQYRLKKQTVTKTIKNNTIRKYSLQLHFNYVILKPGPFLLFHIILLKWMTLLSWI